MNTNQVTSLLPKLSAIKKGDTITIEGVQFNAKKIKQFINMLKHHSYSFELHDENLHLYYQNKMSSGIAKFYGSRKK